MSSIKITVLKKTDIFSNFNDDEIEVISEYSEIQKLKKGDILFRNGDPSSNLYVIKKGEIGIFKYGENNVVIEIARFMENNCFGELSFLTGSKRNAFAIAEIDTDLISFPKSGMSFEEILKIHPKSSAKILHHLLVMVAGKIRQANNFIKENSPIIQELKKQVYIDKMTGIYNKTFMEEKLKGLLHNRKTPLSFISIKPDNFKEINDTFGHEAGDEAIVIFANEIKKLVNNDEILSRYMGNEMIVILPDYDKDKAYQYAIELKDGINRIDLSKATGGVNFNFTISMGISVFPDHADNIDDLISKARELPLISRAKGGNLILFSEKGG